MAVQVERKSQQHSSRQRAAKQDSRSSLPVKGVAGHREISGGQPHANQASGEPYGMRSMPPNATQSIMMQKQPVRAEQHSQQANQASKAPSGAPSQQAACRKLQQASTSGQLTGGQRAAFKISTDPAAHGAQYAHGDQAKDERQLNESSSLIAGGVAGPPSGQGQPAASGQQQQQPNSGSMALECSLTTGPSTLGEPDDPSECSCSNSIDCLTDDGSQANLHAPPPHRPAVHQQHYLHHSQQHPTQTHHLEHCYHNPHQHPYSHPHPHPHQHLRHHHQQNFNQLGQPQVHQQQHHHQARLAKVQDDPFRPAAGPMKPQQQHQHLHQHHHHRDKQQYPYHMHHQQAGSHYPHPMAAHATASNQHRPLLPHASMPPLQSRNYNAYSPPPPLFRHSTYAATSETITDGAPQTMRGPNYTHPSSPVNHDSGHNTNHPSDCYNPHNETDLLIGNKSDTNFRRSAATRGPDLNGWRPASQQQMHGYNSEQAQYHERSDAGLTGGPGGGGGSLQRHTATGRHGSAKSGAHTNEHHQSRMSLGRRQNSQTNDGTGAANSKVSGRQALANDNTQHNSAATAFQCHNDPQQYQQQQQHQQDSATSNPNPMHSNLQSRAGAAAGADLLNASSGGVMGAVSPFEAAATFCPPILTIPPPPLPIGPMAITSHRTNSPWMRLSSIILTPVGIVIAFFIVISPLLHYLM